MKTQLRRASRSQQAAQCNGTRTSTMVASERSKTPHPRLGATRSGNARCVHDGPLRLLHAPAAHGAARGGWRHPRRLGARRTTRRSAAPVPHGARRHTKSPAALTLLAEPGRAQEGQRRTRRLAMPGEGHKRRGREEKKGRKGPGGALRRRRRRLWEPPPAVI